MQITLRFTMYPHDFLVWFAVALLGSVLIGFAPGHVLH
jgi:hypothetical protein